MISPSSRLSSSSALSSSSSRLSCRERPTRTSSAGGRIRSPLRVLSTAVVSTGFLFLAVIVAAASAHVVGAAEEAVPRLGENALNNGSGHPPRNRNVTAVTARTAHGDSSQSGATCGENPLLSRRVDAASYEYGCKQIEVNWGVHKYVCLN